MCSCVPLCFGGGWPWLCPVGAVKSRERRRPRISATLRTTSGTRTSARTSQYESRTQPLSLLLSTGRIQKPFRRWTRSGYVLPVECFKAKPQMVEEHVVMFALVFFGLEMKGNCTVTTCFKMSETAWVNRPGYDPLSANVTLRRNTNIQSQ